MATRPAWGYLTQHHGGAAVKERQLNTSAVNCCSTRTLFHSATPLGWLLPFMPGLKLSADTILRVLWMSNTQCPAVSTCWSPIRLPVHSNALQKQQSFQPKRFRQLLAETQEFRAEAASARAAHDILRMGPPRQRARSLLMQRHANEVSAAQADAALLLHAIFTSAKQTCWTYVKRVWILTCCW